MNTFANRTLSCLLFCSLIFASASTATAREHRFVWQYVHNFREPFVAVPAIAPDGTVILPTQYNIRAFNRDGSQKWTFQSTQPQQGGFVGHGPVVADDGTVYVVDGQTNLVAIAANGTEKWRYVPPPNQGGGATFNTPPSIGTDGSVYVLAGTPTALVSLNPDDGTVRWQFRGEFSFGPMLINSAGTIYLSSAGYSLTAINPDGTLQFRRLGNYGSLMGIGNNDILHTSSPLAAFHPDGTLLWQKSSSAWEAVADYDGLIVGYAPFNAFGLQKIGDDGAIIWRETDSISTYIPRPRVIAADGSIYADLNGELILIQPGGGRQSLSGGWGLGVSQLECVLSDDGILYVTSLYALQAFYVGIGPARSPWPMKQHDAQRTGRARKLPTLPATLTSLYMANQLGFRLTVSGERGTTYLLQHSSDFAQWNTLTNFSISTGVFHFLDPDAQPLPHRFYRVIKE